MLVLGLSMLFYPDVASWWNGRLQRGMVMDYNEEVRRLTYEHIDAQFRRAAEVNADLATLPNAAPLLVAHLATVPDDYMDILYVGGVMARVEIPVIGVNMPVFHTTSTRALDRGIGHLEGTAFPIGGYSTHSVLTAHTGLANARMFSDLEGSVTYGDQFFIDIMGRRLAYEVDQIMIILPHEVESLRVVPGQDLVTLMTCTPYAINSHRLLVRGRRIEYIPYMAEEIVQTIVTTRVDVRIYIFVGLFLLFMLVFGIYSAMKGNEAHNPRRRRSRATEPVPVPVLEAETAAQDKYLESQLIMNDLFSELENPANPPPQARRQAFHEADQHRIYESAVSVSQQGKYRPPDRGRSIKPTTRTTKPAFTGSSGRKKPAQSSSMTKYIAACFVGLLIIIGIGIGVAQAFNQPGSRNGQSMIEDFVTRIEDYNTDYRDRWMAEQIRRWLEYGELTVPDEDAYENPLSWLHSRITEHNRHLYESGQGSLPDPFGYSQDSFNLNYFGFEEEMIGFITIPSIDIEMPIFMGASRSNLHRGLTHITNTSLPIGGTNTNAVIAGYMGLGRTNLLDNLGEISTGDEIHITNFYETIIYTVAYIHQDDPTSTETLTIQSGQDLLTLLGYRQGSTERYTIVAKRSN